MTAAAARLAVLVTVLVALSPSSASGSQLIDRNASRVKLAVSMEGIALLTFSVEGRRREVVARGAVDALAPTRGRQQVELSIDYSGSREPIRSACGRYDRPKLVWLLTAVFPHAPYAGYPRVPTGKRPAGNGARYRVTVIGPGATPDVVWEGSGLPAYDPANPAHVEHEKEMNLALENLESGKRLCHR